MNPPDPKFTIRTLSSHADFHAAEEAQRRIWQIADYRGVISLVVLITTQKNGGLVAGAFDEQGEMIGMLYGFLGFTKSKRLKHCSHIMGVLPELRRSKVGEAIKRFQAEYVRAQGLDLITWTFDPLEGVNANLNIGKLRTITRTYYENLYDEMPDSLNKGIPTDRFEVEWWINHPRVTHATPRPDPTQLLAEGALLVNPAQNPDSHPVPIPGMIYSVESGGLPATLLIEIPPQYQAVKQYSMNLALDWRLHVRQAIQRCFAVGYAITDFVSLDIGNTRKNYYILQTLKSFSQMEPPIPDV
jgi:predicted GNAT superfamily acetyltransferase